MNEDPLAALADIEIPLPPEAATPLLPWLAGLMLAIAVVAVIVARRRRMRLQGQRGLRAAAPVASLALQRLATLQSDWEAGAAGDREAGYRLCTLLRLGLELPALDPAAPPRELPRVEEWAPLLRGLQRLRYARADAALSGEAFELARLWLAAGAARHAAHGHV